jgi:chromosome segregation ATPase
LRSINEILNEGPFPRDEARELLDLVERNIRAGQAAWLLAAIKPMEVELERAITVSEDRLREADRAVAAADLEAESATVARTAAGSNPPLAVVERHLQANQAKAAKQQERQACQSRLSEAQTRLRRLQDVMEALRGERGPVPGDVREVVGRILSASGRLVGVR